MRAPLVSALLVGLCASTWLGATTGAGSATETGSASGAAPKAVVELFTSQGCSSCPPADALLGTFARRPDVVALTLPVDYWDYLGWKDTLADPKFSARQRDYAKESGNGRIYTPQVVVNGLAHVVGSSAADIDGAIADTARRLQHQRIPVAIRLEGERLVIEAGESENGTRSATIWLAVLQKDAEVPVRSGENRGRKLAYYNVVRDLTPVGMWSGKPVRIELSHDAVKLPGTHGCAVLVQSGKGGPIIGAAMLASF